MGARPGKCRHESRAERHIVRRTKVIAGRFGWMTSAWRPFLDSHVRLGFENRAAHAEMHHAARFKVLATSRRPRDKIVQRLHRQAADVLTGSSAAVGLSVASGEHECNQLFPINAMVEVSQGRKRPRVRASYSVERLTVFVDTPTGSIELGHAPMLFRATVLGPWQ